MPPVAVIAIQLVWRTAYEADVEIEVTIAVEIAPRGGAGFHVVRQADGSRHILEPAVVLAIEAIRTTAEPDELVEIPVVIEVGPRIRLTAGRGKELRLDQLERRRGISETGEGDNEERGGRNGAKMAVRHGEQDR